MCDRRRGRSVCWSYQHLLFVYYGSEIESVGGGVGTPLVGAGGPVGAKLHCQLGVCEVSEYARIPVRREDDKIQGLP